MSYNYNPKVLHPDKILPQMESGEFQPSFYFGGSQVPVNLGIKGSGVCKKSPYKSHVMLKEGLDCQGRGIKTTCQKYCKIYLPKKI
jgi:hypothetical protein